MVKECVVALNTRRKSKAFPEQENNLRVWVTKHWRNYQRTSQLPSLLGSSMADNSIVNNTMEHLVGDEAPLHVQFRSDGSVIPMEEIIRLS